MRKDLRKRHIKIYKRKPKKNEDDIISNLQQKYNEIDVNKIQSFQDIPLSENTLKGLTNNGYLNPTEIQKTSIVYSLKGEDVLGAAKTGSGKTLAFLIPILELLYCKKWTRLDGIGALVITPTRELAYQIFETLRKIGKYHDYSAGLIIGGKDLKFETKRMDQCNIVICTPGRLLQHMDENPLFDCTSLQILILDEADRCLDMGFEETLNGIIENLPQERQTLLFSATQTKCVGDLARLSLKDARYVSVHEDAKYSTPPGLIQSYMICQLHQKMDLLWSFIKNHKKHKILVFMSSCKQVKYTYESLCRLRPGVSLLALYGSLHQTKRMAIYDSFCSKQNAVLFATDIAARGLDFPNINWVVQLDCPENANEYIHRAGRTARYENHGEALLVLLPSEVKMLKKLEDRKIPIQQIKVNENKLQSIQKNLECSLAKDGNLKASAQRAFVSYVKSVFLMKDKEIFNVNELNTDSYARSLGLAIPPRIRFLQKHKKQLKENTSDKEWKRNENNEENKEQDEEDENTSEEDESVTKGTKNDILDFYGDDNEDDFLSIKRKDHDLDEIEAETKSYKPHKVITKAAIAKKLVKKNLTINKRTLFNEEGTAMIDTRKEYACAEGREYANTNEGGIDIAKAKKILKEEDKFDKELFRKRVKEKHKEEKRKAKEARKIRDESDDDDEENGPDLSILEKLEKIYETNEDESSIRRIKRSHSKQFEKNKRFKETLAEDSFDKSLLNQDEELAFQLMSNK